MAVSRVKGKKIREDTACVPQWTAYEGSTVKAMCVYILRSNAAELARFLGSASTTMLSWVFYPSD